jgi:hypothetical protein
VLGMVSADDPFAPGQVLDWVAEMRELPVQEPGHGERRRVEQHVIRPEVAVDDHPPGRARQIEVSYGHGVQHAEQPAGARSTGRMCPCSIRSWPAVHAGRELHGELAGKRRVDLGHRHATAQAVEHLAFSREACGGVRALVGLDDDGPAAGGVIGVAVSQRVHVMMFHAAGARVHREFARLTGSCGRPVRAWIMPRRALQTWFVYGLRPEPQAECWLYPDVEIGPAAIA